MTLSGVYLEGKHLTARGKAMNQTKENLTNSIRELKQELKDYDPESEAYYYTQNEIDFLTDDLHREFAKDCIAEGEHFRMTVSDGGYDVCFNCGAKN